MTSIPLYSRIWQPTRPDLTTDRVVKVVFAKMKQTMVPAWHKHQWIWWSKGRKKHFFHALTGVERNVWKLKVDVPILTCIFFIFNWLTLTSEMHFVKFHPEVVSCLLSRGKRKYAPLGMRLLWKYIRNYFLVYQLTSHFLLYLENYKEFEAEILDLK